MIYQSNGGQLINTAMTVDTVKLGSNELIYLHSLASVTTKGTLSIDNTQCSACNNLVYTNNAGSFDSLYWNLTNIDAAGAILMYQLYTTVAVTGVNVTNNASKNIIAQDYATLTTSFIYLKSNRLTGFSARSRETWIYATSVVFDDMVTSVALRANDHSHYQVNLLILTNSNFTNSFVRGSEDNTFHTINTYINNVKRDRPSGWEVTTGALNISIIVANSATFAGNMTQGTSLRYAKVLSIYLTDVVTAKDLIDFFNVSWEMNNATMNGGSIGGSILNMTIGSVSCLKIDSTAVTINGKFFNIRTGRLTNNEFSTYNNRILNSIAVINTGNVQSTQFSISNSFVGELWKVTDGTFDSNEFNVTRNTVNSSMLTLTGGSFLTILSAKITDNNIGQNTIYTETNDITAAVRSKIATFDELNNSTILLQRDGEYSIVFDLTDIYIPPDCGDEITYCIYNSWSWEFESDSRRLQMRDAYTLRRLLKRCLQLSKECVV